MVFQHGKLKLRRLLEATEIGSIMSICISCKSKIPYKDMYTGAFYRESDKIQCIYKLQVHESDNTKIRIVFWYQNLSFIPMEYFNEIPLYINVSDYVIDGSASDVFSDYKKFVKSSPYPWYKIDA